MHFKYNFSRVYWISFYLPTLLDLAGSLTILSASQRQEGSKQGLLSDSLRGSFVVLLLNHCIQQYLCRFSRNICIHIVRRNYASKPNTNLLRFDSYTWCIAFCVTIITSLIQVAFSSYQLRIEILIGVTVTNLTKMCTSTNCHLY